MDEASTVFAVGATKTWQAARLYNTALATSASSGSATRSPVSSDEIRDPLESGIELAYLVEPLSSNQDLVSRFTTGLRTGAILHADEASWTDRAQPPKLNYDSMQSKIGCNFHPTSAWASIHSLFADSSLAMLTDRARAAASLAEGVLEYVLHRHATGGNGRGPSDGDPHSARGTVTILPAADRTSFLEAQERQPMLALRRAHPVAMLLSAPLLYIDLVPPPPPPPLSLVEQQQQQQPPWAKSWSPLTAPLPSNVHLFGLGRRAFQSGAGSGNVPSYPSAGQPRQGAIRLQQLEQQANGISSRSSAGSSNRARVAVDLSQLFSSAVGLDLGDGKLEERTLSLARRPAQVKRRSWRGVGTLGKVQTPASWRGSGSGLTSNSSTVELGPLDIRSFIFSV